MKTIIIGAGEVGTNIARHMVMENHNVVMIDTNEERLARVNDTVDVQTIHGMGCHPDILEKAGCDSADMVIAVTKSDEMNMVACQMSYSLFNVPKKIARVRHASYLKMVSGHLFTNENMPVDVIISPELEMAKSVLETLDVPGAFDATSFAEGDVSLVGVRLPESSPVMHIPMSHLTSSSHMEFVVVAIYRGGRMLLPKGSDHIEPGDDVYLVCKMKDRESVMSFLGFQAATNINRAFVIGGGQIGYELCKAFEERGIQGRILENDIEKARLLAERLKNTMVVHGDFIDAEMYMQEYVGSMDVFLAMTDDDGVNILSSVLARKMGAKSVVTRINKSAYMPVTGTVPLQKVVSLLEITASKILQHVRRGEIKNVHSIQDGHAQIIEAKVTSGSYVASMRVGDVTLPHGVSICAIYNPEKGMILPRSKTLIQEGDRIVLFATVDNISVVDKMF